MPETTTQRVPPHDLDAEQAILGALIIDPSHIEQARHQLVAADFYKAQHRDLFDTLIRMWLDGVKIDAVTIGDRMAADGNADARRFVHETMLSPPSISSWPHYAEIVVRHAAARKLLYDAAMAVQKVYEGEDPFKVKAQLDGELDMMGVGQGVLPEDLSTTEQLSALGDEIMPDWVVPHLLREGDRMILVAEEGLGKSVFTMQFAMMAAQGVNPLWPTNRFAPMTTLILDLENPQYVLRQRTRDMQHRLRSLLTERYTSGLSWLWHRQYGIDIRSRGHQRELDAIFAHVQPRLVVISPLYKAFRKQGREDHEDVAAELQVILDGWRERFGFALMIEHHAPKGSNNVRDMAPYGSSLWLRWPEFGIALVRDKDTPSKVRFGRFRNDRVRNAAWPTSISHGQQWPWVGRWQEGNPWDQMEEI